MGQPVDEENEKEVRVSERLYESEGEIKRAGK